MGYSFLHAADLHIDSPLRGLERYEEAPVEAIRGATREAFANLVQDAIDRQVAFVILAGDVFDGNWRDYGTGLWFAARLRELVGNGIRVYLLAGNHDAAGKMTAQLRHPDGVFVFDTRKPQSFVDAPTGAVLHGQGFATAAVTEDLASGYPMAVPGALNIGVLHTALSGREGHERYAPCTPDGLLAKGYDYWALGHVHQREVVAEAPWIVFPGNLQARHARETGAKGASLVTVEDGRIVAVEAQSYDVVRFARVPVDVAACKSVAACEDAVGSAMRAACGQAEGRLLAMRIELVGATAVDAALRRARAAFVAACRERANGLGAAWLEKVVFSTRPRGQASGNDIRQALELDEAALLAEARARAEADLQDLMNKLGGVKDADGQPLALGDELLAADLVAQATLDLVARLVDRSPRDGGAA